MDITAMYKANEGLIHTVISDHYPYLIGTPYYDDAFQEGSIGLLKAIKNYNPATGYKFSTYAYPSIQRTIFRGIFRLSSPMRISRGASDIYMKYKSYVEKGLNFNKIAQKLNISPAMLLDVLNAFNTDYLDNEILSESETKNLTWYDTLKNDLNIEKEIERKHLAKIAKTLCQLFLTDEENLILFNHYKGMTQSELSKILKTNKASLNRKIIKIEKNIFPLFKAYIEEDISFGELCVKIIEKRNKTQQIRVVAKCYLDYVLECIQRGNYTKEFSAQLEKELQFWGTDKYIMMLEFMAENKHFPYQVLPFLSSFFKIIDKYYSKSGIEFIVYDILVASKNNSYSHVDNLLDQIR